MTGVVDAWGWRTARVIQASNQNARIDNAACTVLREVQIVQRLDFNDAFHKFIIQHPLPGGRIEPKHLPGLQSLRSRYVVRIADRGVKRPAVPSKGANLRPADKVAVRIGVPGLIRIKPRRGLGRGGRRETERRKRQRK